MKLKYKHKEFNIGFKIKLPKLCWECGRKFWGGRIYFKIEPGVGIVFVHKACGGKYDFKDL